MISASELKAGRVIRFEKEFYKVVESVAHAGGGKSGGMVHAKLRNLSTGHVAERRWNPDDKIEDVPTDRAKMQYLYGKQDVFTFMNPETFDQVSIPKNAVGPAAAFLKENDVLEVEFFDEKPLSIIYPPVVELKVRTTGAGLKGQSDSTYKEATLENGMTVLVPQFIKEGDPIRLDVETGKYLERALAHEEKGAKFTVAAPKSGQPKSAEAPAKEPPKKEPGKKEASK